MTFLLCCIVMMISPVQNRAFLALEVYVCKDQVGIFRSRFEDEMNADSSEHARLESKRASPVIATRQRFFAVPEGSLLF